MLTWKLFTMHSSRAHGFISIKSMKIPLNRHIIKQNAGTIATVLLLAFLVPALLAPWKKIRDLQRPFPAEDACMGDQDAREVVRKHACMESRVTLAVTETIGLVISLADSLVMLEINGISLHTVRTGKYDRSRVFDALSCQAYQALFSTPLRVEGHRSTIIKEPVVIRKAPRDTVEAAMTSNLPEMPPARPEHVKLSLSHGFTVYLHRDGSEKGREHPPLFSGFSLAERIRQACAYIPALAFFHIPEYHPSITLYLPGKDIITIYRALPEHARVVVRI